MSLHRYQGRGATGFHVNSVTVGEWPYAECTCGKWLSQETGEHVEALSLTEFLQRNRVECPDKKGGKG